MEMLSVIDMIIICVFGTLSIFAFVLFVLLGSPTPTSILISRLVEQRAIGRR
jgi:hypothetical protein